MVHLGSAGSRMTHQTQVHNTRTNIGRKTHRRKHGKNTLVQQRLILPKIVEEDDIWGDIPIADHNTCRVVMQNVNGIKGEHDFASAHNIAEHIQQIEGNIIGMIETNVDWKSKGAQKTCNNIFRKYWTRISVAVSSSDRRQGSVYQPGGTYSLVTSPWAARSISGKDSSGLGRWSTITIMGRSNRQVTFITAYRVDGTRNTKGPFTAYSQQLYLLEERDAVNTDPITTFYNDLRSVVMELKVKKHEIVIMLDANSCLEDNKSLFSKWVSELQLIDPMTARHGTERQPATFQGGKHRIDYVLMTTGLYKYVTRAGILPFQSFYTSDHRALFVDIDLALYLKGEPTLELAMESRYINGKNQNAMLKYKQVLEEFFQRSDILQRLQRFEHKYGTYGELSETLAMQLDQMDNELTAAKLLAEAACKRKAQVPWSPRLKLCNDEIHYWKLWRKEILTKRDFGAKRANIPVGFTIPIQYPTLSAVRHEIKQAESKLRDCKLHAAEYRDTFLAEQVRFHGQCNDKKAKAAVARIKQAEHLSGIFMKLKAVMGKSHGPGIAFLLLPVINGEHKTIVDSDDIEENIRESNYRHFGQANDTTFAKRLIKLIFGTYGTNDESKQLLDGIIPTGLDNESEAMHSIMKKMKRHDAVIEIDGRVTMDEVRNGYKKWRESTTTSPSGCHLGHDKAAVNMPPPMDDDEANFSNTYFEVKTRLLNIALQHCHIYPRWKRIVNALIEKIPGLPILGKIRVIHIIESDINLLMGIAWGRKLMWQGEELQVFGEEQSGGRKGKRCQDVLLFKQLVYSILRLSKSNGSTFDNDAKSCYDRIVMLGASLMAQRIGMHPGVIELFMKMLNEVNYHAKTIYGVSELSYKSSPEYGIHGPGQGGRASPSVWTVISCLILSCMEEKAIGAKLMSPNGKIRVSQLSSGFVDDITHWNIDMERSLASGDNSAIINEETTVAAQWWEELLYTTGGKLELTKCFYYQIIWDFDKNGNALLLEPTSNIILTDSADQRQVPIEAKSCAEAHRTLGVMTCPKGDNTAEFKRMQEKCGKFAQRMYSAMLSREEALIFYRTICIPSITYSLAVGTFTEKQMSSLQGSLTQATLNGLGYNRKTPAAVVYGPPTLGGIGLRHLYAEQGTMQVQIVIQHLRAYTQVGATILIQLNWAQLVSGRSKGILEIPMENLPHLDDELWIQTMRRFLRVSQVTLHIDDIVTPVKKRINDEVIMDLIAVQTWTNAEIRQINKCRLFMRIESVSEMCTASGSHVTDNHWNVIIGSGHNNKMWPIQGHPGAACIATWKRFVKSICKDGTKALRVPLKSWTSPHHGGRWDAIYDEIVNTITVRSIDSVIQFHDIKQHRKKWTGTKSTWVDAATFQYRPHHGMPIDIISMNDTSITCKIPCGNTYDEVVQIRLAQTWHEYIEQLPEWERMMICGSHTLDERYPLWMYLHEPNNVIHIVSDGGVINNRGSFGWVIACPGRILVQCMGTVFGTRMTSHRAEVYGITSWLLYLYHYTEYLQCEIKCNVHSFCDNKAAIANVNNFIESPRNSMIPDFDLVHEANMLLQTLKAEGQVINAIEHVKGHQDSSVPEHKLSWTARLNIKADKLASSVLESSSVGNRNMEVSHNPVRLMMGVDIVTANEVEILRWRWREFVLQEYYEEKYNLRTTALSDINWAALQLARKKIPTRLVPFSVKLMIQWLPVGNRMAKYGNEMTMCYFCGNEEDFQHLFCCARKAKQQKDFITDLQNELRTIDTEPEIQKALVARINEWMTGETNDTPTWSNTIQHACQRQGTIGWDKVISGLFSNEWSKLQERFKPSKMGDSWQSAVCQFMATKAHLFWTERNDKMYEHDNTNKINREEEEILAQIRNLYATKMDMSHYDAIELFGIPIERRLKFSVAANKAWIIPTRREAMKRCKSWLRKLKSRQPDIRQFFGRKNDKVNETMEMDESVGSGEEEAANAAEGDEEEEELDIGDAIKQQQQLTQTPGPCTRENYP
jgi:ribonuclease HI